MSWLGALLYGTGAGLAISILDYAALSTVPPIQRPATFTDRVYLVKFFGHPLVGGFLAIVLQQTQPGFTPLLAAMTGAAAPAIWRILVRAGTGMVKGLVREFNADGDE